MKTKSGTLFKSKLLERLTRTHIAIPVSMFLLYALALAFLSVNHYGFTYSTTMLLFFIGLIVFTWVEYNVHRFIFHLKADSSKKEKFQYMVHGIHHDYPKDKERLAMPPILSLTIATLLLILFKWVLGLYTFGFLSGFLTGYAFYLLVHYVVHAFAPPRNFFRILWINHSIHHYKNPDKAFGVSSPLWDYVYKTSP